MSGAVAARDLENVAKAPRRHETGARPCALRQRVDHDRRAVRERGHLREIDVSLLEDVENSLREIGRRRRGLREAEPAGSLVELDEIGERATDVCRDATAHGCRLDRPARRAAVSPSSTVIVSGSMETP